MTASRPDRLLPVDIEGDINLQSPAGRTLKFAASGATMQLSIPDWQDLHSLAPRPLLAQRRSLLAATRLLSRLSLGLSIDVAGRTIMHIGNGARTTLFARLLGLRDTSISVRTALALLKTRPSG